MKTTKTRERKPSSGWGGKRAGAGRPPIPGRRRPVAHRPRAEHQAAHPVHLTLHTRAGFPSLRSGRVFPGLREALRAASSADFRVLHFSAGKGQLQLIVEARDTGALVRGSRGVTIRAARAINNQLDRSGPVWGDRYKALPLQTPEEVRAALLQVLMHFRTQDPTDRRAFDPCSSAAWFDGFQPPAPPSGEPSPVCAPRTWLASVGWRKAGLIKRAEKPGPGS